MADPVTTRIPDHLKAFMVAESNERDVSLQTIILEALSKRYKVKNISPPQIGRPKGVHTPWQKKSRKPAE